MAADPSFTSYCCELLGSVGPCTARRMFGGAGISTGGLTIALLADLGRGEKLWLKASEETRHLFEAAGCEPFVYEAKGKPVRMNYYSAPEDAMESPQLMTHWARLSLDCALKARTGKPVRVRPAIKPARPRASRPDTPAAMPKASRKSRKG